MPQMPLPRTPPSSQSQHMPNMPYMPHMPHGMELMRPGQTSLQMPLPPPPVPPTLGQFPPPPMPPPDLTRQMGLVPPGPELAAILADGPAQPPLPPMMSTSVLGSHSGGPGSHSGMQLAPQPTPQMIPQPMKIPQPMLTAAPPLPPPVLSGLPGVSAAQPPAAMPVSGGVLSAAALAAGLRQVTPGEAGGGPLRSPARSKLIDRAAPYVAASNRPVGASASIQLGGFSLSSNQLGEVIASADRAMVVLLAEGFGHEMNFVHVARLWGRLGTLLKDSPDAGEWAAEHMLQLGSLLRLTEPHILSCGAYEIAQILGGITESQLPHSETRSVRTELCQRARDRMGKANPKDMTDLSVAFALYDPDARVVFSAAEAHADRTGLREHSTRQLADVAWAFATADERSPDLFELVVRLASKRLHQFRPRPLASLLWALAEADIHAPSLFEAGAFEAVATNAPAKLLQEVGLKVLTDLLWAFASAGVDAPALFDAAAENVLTAIRDGVVSWNDQVGRLLWAFAASRVRAPDLFDAIGEAVPHLLPQLSPRSVSQLAWAFAHDASGDAAKLLFGAMATAPLSLASFSLREVSDVAWALAVTSHSEQALHVACCERVAALLREKPRRAADSLTLAQLHTWQICCMVELQRPSLLLPEEERETCRRALDAKPPSGRILALQESVASALAAHKVTFERSLRLPEGYVLGIAILEHKVALEVDGPLCFSMPDSLGLHRPTGGTFLRRRQLAALGWTVVSIPFFDWESLNGDSEFERAYVGKRLAATASAHFTHLLPAE